MATSAQHHARRHSGFFALELLADDRSITFDRPLVRAIYEIGDRDTPKATAAEWALLHLAEHLLEQMQEKEEGSESIADVPRGQFLNASDIPRALTTILAIQLQMRAAAAVNPMITRKCLRQLAAAMSDIPPFGRG